MTIRAARAFHSPAVAVFRVTICLPVAIRMAVPICYGGLFGCFAVEELGNDIESHRQRAAEHFVRGFLNRTREMRSDPFADEVIRDGNLKAVLLQVELGGITKPNMEALLSHALSDSVR